MNAQPLDERINPALLLSRLSRIECDVLAERAYGGRGDFRFKLYRRFGRHSPLIRPDLIRTLEQQRETQT